MAPKLASCRLNYIIQVESAERKITAYAWLYDVCRIYENM